MSTMSAPSGFDLSGPRAEWLFLPEALAEGGTDLNNIVSFGTRVLEEDAAICEVNQRGLHTLRHQAGVLIRRSTTCAASTTGCGPGMRMLDRRESQPTSHCGEKP